jgi:hypothetical protein
MSKYAHLFCFNIALNELRWRKMLPRVPKLVIIKTVLDEKREIIKNGRMKNKKQ